MNMTDEILNSWTDADNYLADRIETDENAIAKKISIESTMACYRMSGFSNEFCISIASNNNSTTNNRTFIQIAFSNQGGLPPVIITVPFTVTNSSSLIIGNTVKVDNPNGTTYDAAIYTKTNSDNKTTYLDVYFPNTSNIWGVTYITFGGEMDKYINIQAASSIRSDSSAVVATQKKVSYS